MDRAERTGLGVAVALHAALFGALSLNLLKPPVLPKLATNPIEVTLSDEVALESSAPEIAPAPAPPTPEPLPMAPAPALAPAPPVARPEPKPVPKQAVKPAPAPKPTAKAPPKKPVKPAAASEKSAPTQRRAGLSRDILAGLSDAPSRNQPATSASGAPAKAVSAAVASSIGAEVRRQLKPHWKSPSGADVELLRTTLSVKLNRDGSLSGAPELVSQSGVNASNRAQARLHVDQAIKAVRLAAPFKLPTEFYDAWKDIRPTFDRRLSQ
jgi:outer membrane biosynthesis protein TonB